MTRRNKKNKTKIFTYDDYDDEINKKNLIFFLCIVFFSIIIKSININ